MGVLGNSFGQLISALCGLYLLAVLLRFLLQVARADFYNPISQAVVRITDPLVRVFRSFVPGYRGIDFSSLMLAFVIESISICLLLMIYGYEMQSLGFIITYSFVGVLHFIIMIYYYAIIASIIMSFVMLFSGNMNPHPLLRLVWQLTEPVMAPIRTILPPMGGLDFSPIFIFIGIGFIRSLLIDAFNIGERIAQVVVGI